MNTTTIKRTRKYDCLRY